MSEKRRRRVSKLIVRITPQTKEDRKKARSMEEFISYQMRKGLTKIEQKIKGKLRDLLLGRKV